MKVAYFSAGTVGAGHILHGIALRRALGRAGFFDAGGGHGEYRMFGPPRPFGAAEGQAGSETIEIRNDATLHDRDLAQTSRLAEALRRFAPDLLIVDMFWMPLRWVLPALSCEAWLLVRICPPVWLTGPRQAPFDAAQYSRIVAMEPVDYPAVRERIDPIVVCNPDECRPPEALRERLGLSAGRPLVAVVHAGERGERAVLEETAGEGAVVLDLFEEGAIFPAAEWLGGADRIVCGLGYNSYWEARWLGYDGRTRFVPFPRAIDDQALRQAAFADHRMRENGADRLARWIVGS